MNDTYYEQIVAKEGNVLGVAIRIMVYFLLLVLFILSMMQPMLVVALIALAGGAFYYIFPRLKIEYEYSCLNSEFNIDAIFSKSSRKHITSFDVKNVERIAPLDKFDMNRYQGVKIYNFTGNAKLLRTYALMVADGGNKRIFYLSLDNAMLDLMKNYVPKFGYEV